MKRRRVLIIFILVSIALVILKLNYNLFNDSSISIDNFKEVPFDGERKEITNYDEVSILKYNKGSIKSRLKEFSKENTDIKNILNNYEDYPEALLEALSYNPEMASFVLEYPRKKYKYYSDNVGKIKDSVPALFQWDERWGYAKYGDNLIAVSGCGPTALSMVVTYLTKNNTYTPYYMAKFAEDNNYYLNGSGTTWDLMRKGSTHFGVKVKELSLDKNVIYEALEKNHPIICSMRKSDFTINGHYIVLAGIKNGKIIVNDPNSKIRSSVLWDYERIKNGIKNLWEFYI